MSRTLTSEQLLRHFIGFDGYTVNSDSFPPHNIEKLSDTVYALTLAVAGYQADDLSMVQHHGVLTISGERVPDPEPRAYLHQGIAFRNWSRQFNLGEYVEVVSAELHNGLLEIVLERNVPDAERPRKIEIR